MASIRIFAPGTHRSAKGETITFSTEDVSAIAAAYDPALHQAPLVRGHPASDAPALGWVDGLTVKGGELFAECGNVAPEIKADVDVGRYRFVSSAFYRPDEASNPTPGKWHLRHVGLLGAMPPSVKGLGRVAFNDAGADLVTVEFGERPSVLSDAFNRIGWVFTALADSMRGTRERLIEAQGVEEADKTAPAYQIDQLTAAAVELRAAARDVGEPRPALFSDPTSPDPDTTTTEEDRVSDAELQAENARLKAENERLAKADAQRAANAAHAANVAFCEGLVQAAKLPQGQAATVVSLLDHLGGAKPEQPVAFSDGDGKSIGPDAALKGLLAGLAPKVAFAELATPEADAPPVAFSMPAGDGFQVDGASLELHRRAVAHAAQHKVPYADAVRAVGGR